MKKEKYFISVGEPWDFESPDGQNIIKGDVLNILSNNCLVFKTNYDLKFGSISGNVLILTPRQQQNNFSDLKDKLVVVNGSLLLKEYNQESSEQELKSNSKFEIVGSIRKETN